MALGRSYHRWLWENRTIITVPLTQHWRTWVDEWHTPSGALAFMSQLNNARKKVPLYSALSKQSNRIMPFLFFLVCDMQPSFEYGEFPSRYSVQRRGFLDWPWNDFNYVANTYFIKSANSWSWSGRIYPTCCTAHCREKIRGHHWMHIPTNKVIKPSLCNNQFI